MLISYYANKQSSPRLPSWQPSLIFFNVPIESGSIIKPCTLKHFQVTYRLHKAGYWTINVILAWIRSYMHKEVWDEITNPFPNFNSALTFGNVGYWNGSWIVDVYTGQLTPVTCCHMGFYNIRAGSRFALSQWETALFCNDVSHWLSVSLESAL